jgi:hypothetical protein
MTKEMLARHGHDTSEAKRTLNLFARTLDIQGGPEKDFGGGMEGGEDRRS